MKVLILHQHFNTPDKGGAIRSWYLAHALVERGISAVVITGHNGRNYRKTIVGEIEVHYLPVAYDNTFGFAARSISFLRFVWQSVRHAKKLEGITHCYAISAPLTVGLAAIRIKRTMGIPFLFEVGDLWPDAPIQMGFIRNPVFRKLLYVLEARIYQEAEAVVALSCSIKDAIEKKTPGKTVHFLSNMSDTDYFSPEIRRHDLEKKFGVAGKFVISYIGALGFANGLEYFLECAKAAQEADMQAWFFICGEGAMEVPLRASAKRLGIRNLTFTGFQNREGVRDLMNITDAIFVCYKEVPVLETGSPNKYFDGLAAGKLIIVNFGGWIRDEIERNHCGVYLSPNDPSQVVTILSPLVEDVHQLNSYKQAARNLAEQHYSRKMLSAKFADLFQENRKWIVH